MEARSTDQRSNGQRTRATLVNGIAGGANVIGFTTGRWRSRVRDLPEVLGELPASTMIDEMCEPGDGQIRALITVGGNPALTSPDATATSRRA